MQIHIELLGALKDLVGTAVSMELVEGSRVEELLAKLDLPAGSVHCVTVNGRLVHDHSHQLVDGDQLSLVPPVIGG